MFRDRWIDFGSVATALGGLSWLAKVAVIVSTDGEVNDEGAAALFYLTGVALMVAGSTAIGVLLVGHRARWMLAMAVALSPIIFILSFIILDGIAKPLVGDRGPAYFGEEAGILTMGLVWLVLGIGLFKATHRSHAVGPVVRLRGSSDSGRVTTP